jgi:hypothetical protein
LTGAEKKGLWNDTAVRLSKVRFADFGVVNHRSLYLRVCRIQSFRTDVSILALGSNAVDIISEGRVSEHGQN